MAFDVRVLVRGRAAAEARMTETVIAGTFQMRTVAGKATRVLVVKKYEGIARVVYPSARVVSERATAGQDVATQALAVHLPVAAPMLADGDEVQVTGSDSDGTLFGRVYQVTGVPDSGQVTAHRYPVKEQT